MNITLSLSKGPPPRRDFKCGFVKPPTFPEGHPTFGQREPLPNRPSGKLLLGDAIHKLAGPIGVKLRVPCMKLDGTIDLKPGSPCDKAKTFLNKI